MPDFGFDPLRAFDQLRRLAADAPAQIEQLRRLAADAPAQLAEGLGRLVRDSPPARLEAVMRSPARRPLLDGIFWQMPRQLDAAQAKDTSMTIRWCITGRADDGVDTYHLHVENGQAHTSHDREGRDPRLTITLDGAEFLRLVSGNSDPMAAYFKGRIKLAGDIMVAARLAQMLRAPGRGGSPPSGGANGATSAEPGVPPDISD